MAQKKVDEVKGIMQDNVIAMSENTKLLDEETVPSALAIAETAYEVQEQAEEVKKEEQKRGRSLNFIIVLIVLGVVALLALILYFLFG